MNWMDIVVVAILVIASIEGYIKGFVVSFIGIASWFIAIICAMKFYKHASDYIVANTPIYEKIHDVINDKLATVASVPLNESSSDIFSYVKLPKIFEGILSPELSIGNTVGEVISKLMVDIISMILIFVIVKILLIIIAMLLDKIVKLPILNVINRLTGLLFGFLKGGIIILVILALLVPIISVMPNDNLVETLEASKFAEYLYDNNLLLKLVEGYF